MKKITLVMIIILLIILASSSLLYLGKRSLFAGYIIKGEKYSFTTAICNETNYCEDHEIYCDGNKTLEIKATGFATQHTPSWKDPRGKQDLENLCE